MLRGMKMRVEQKKMLVQWMMMKGGRSKTMVERRKSKNADKSVR